MFHKYAVARSLFNRSKLISSSTTDRQREDDHIKNVLKDNGYPVSVIQRSRQMCDAEKDVSDKQETQSSNGVVVLPYIGHLSEGIKRILSKLNIRTCFKPFKTLRQLLVHPKDHINLKDRTNVIYRIDCRNCALVYIGQTGRTIHHRVREHKRALESETYYASAVASHAHTSNHVIDWEGAAVLEQEHRLYQRCYLEAWHIRGVKDSMNRDEGFLPQEYNSLIKHV